jgi:hypothetical protein
MKIYLSGKITGKENYEHDFNVAEKRLKAEGHIVLNPCVHTEGLTYDEYMHIDFAMIDVSDAVYMLKDWRGSKGANLEHNYAIRCCKEIIYEV